MSDAREQYGPAIATLTPPIDALATVVIGGDPVTTLSVPSGERLAVHAESREAGNLDEVSEQADETTPLDEIPEPAGSVPGEIHAEARTTRPSWVGVFVGDDSRLRVSTGSNERITIHAEPDRTTEVEADEKGAEA